MFWAGRARLRAYAHARTYDMRAHMRAFGHATRDMRAYARKHLIGQITSSLLVPK